MSQLLGSATGVGELRVPQAPLGIIVVFDEQPAVVRDTLDAARFVTLQLDSAAFGSDALASRAYIRGIIDQLLAATDWIAARGELAGLAVGVFGSAAGGSAALAAATERPTAFRAIVARDGRPTLGGSALGGVLAATLFIADGQDDAAVAFSQDAMTRVQGIAELEILGASDAGTPAHVASLARRWFARFLQ
jgi:dienelactone hydrolase